MRTRILWAVALAVLLGLAACGDADTGSADTAACLAGAEDCADVPGTTGPAVTPPASGALSVADVLSDDIDGPFAIAGYYVAVGADIRLCEALAESFPPQCGGASIPFEHDVGADFGPLQAAGDVVWSDTPIEVEGEVVDGTFVAR